MWTGCQEISKVARMTKKTAKVTRFCQNWLVHLALMACLLRFLLSIFSNLPWCREWVSKVFKMTKKTPNITRLRQNWLVYLALMACSNFLFHLQWIYHDVDKLSRDIKSSQNDQKNAKNYQISSKLFGASGINGLLAPISYFHLQWIYPDVDRLSRDTKSEFTITEWPQGRARCAAPSALLLLCFPQKPELATVQWDNQIGGSKFQNPRSSTMRGILDPTSFCFTITNLEQRWKPKLSWRLNMNPKKFL